MKKQTIYYTCLIAFVVLNLTACRKDKPELPNNPLNGRTTAVFNPDKNYGKMFDVDGNQYKTIKIGNQTWMAENLRVTHYQNGAEISNITDNEEWAALTTGAYCNYNNTNDLDTIATYGRLYNWYAVADMQNLAPEGWRVPRIADWLELIEYLGGDTIASKHLKETGTIHWDGPNNADNNSGFTALPGGWRYQSLDAEQMFYYAMFWSSSYKTNQTSACLMLFTWDNNVYKKTNYNVNGYSVRCIKE